MMFDWIVQQVQTNPLLYPGGAIVVTLVVLGSALLATSWLGRSSNSSRAVERRHPVSMGNHGTPLGLRPDPTAMGCMLLFGAPVVIVGALLLLLLLAV